MSGGARVSSGMKKTIQDIREIAGQHSDEDIYAMLKECAMDPNETTQRLLHLDTFHEVKKKHGRRKENIENRAFNNPRQQQSARAGREAKAGRGNFHFQNASQNDGRRLLGGGKENGYNRSNMTKGHRTENKSAPQMSRPDDVKVNGSDNLSIEKNIHGGAPWANEKISLNGNHLLSASPAVPPSSCTSLEGVHIDTPLLLNNSVPGDHHIGSNGNATWCNDQIQNGGPISHVPSCIGTDKNQLTDSVFNGQIQQAICAAKDAEPKETDKHVEDFISENDVSVVLEEASKLNISDGQHVVFPEHLQVPEAYKKKLTFGSFDSIWAIDGKQIDDCIVIDKDILVDVSCPASVSNVAKASTESNGVLFSTVKDAQESKDPSHLQSPSPNSGSASAITGHALPDLVIKIDEPDTENLMRNGGFELSKSANQSFDYVSQAHLQVQDSAEPQVIDPTRVGNFTASSTTVLASTSIVNPPGSSHDLISSPPPAPILRQTYHPDFFPYGHYYPQFFVPQVQQYMTHGGLTLPPSVANAYLSSPVAASIKYPQQQSKQGSNAGTESYIGVPAGYNPYIPYVFPYVPPPVVIPGNGVGDGDHETQSKENTAATHTPEQQIESLGEWMGGTGRTGSAMQVNPLYGFGLGHGHPMVFPHTPAAYGAFGGVYHPSAQTIPAPQPTLNSQIHQPQSMGPGELAVGAMPPIGFYQQQQQQQLQGAHITWNNKQQ